MFGLVTLPPRAGITIFRPSERVLTLPWFTRFSDDIAAPMRIFLDGREVGDLWANQSKHFAVEPGTHTVQLRQYMVRFNKLVVSVEAEQTAELACWSGRWAILSKVLPYPYLHPMTSMDRRRAERLAAKNPQPTPRNLAEE